MTALCVLSFLLLLVNFADVCYTLWAIKYRGAREGIPWWEWLSHNPVAFITVSTLFHAAILFALYGLYCPAWALGIGLFGRVMVMVRNVNIVRDRRQG